MLTMIIAGRFGHDGELKYTPEGTAILEMSIAADYYSKGADKNRATQWVRTAMFGKRGESLADYVKKGGACTVMLTDVHVEEWTKKDGTLGVALKGIAQDVALQGSASVADDAAVQSAKAGGAGNAKAKAKDDDFNDDIPF